MKYIEIIKILTKWSCETGNYELLYNLYILFNIGIPNKLLYKLPSKGEISFNHISAMNDVYNKDLFFLKIMEKFRRSKYIRLKYWKNSFGFIKIY